MRPFNFQLSTFNVPLWFSTVILCLLSTFVVSDRASAQLTAKANHDHISIDFFYHGSSVSVRGVSDPGTDLIIKIASVEGEQALRKKGKVAGVLWMNVGQLTFNKVPNLYSLHSTRKIEDILSTDEMDKKVIGYQALVKHAEMEPATDAGEKEKWFGEFVKFKESSKLYSVTSGKIGLTENNGTQNYYVLLEWPYQARPDDYTITVYAVKDHRVVETAETHVSVEQVGVVKSLAGMARNNGALYGVVSIMAALAAGFGVGMVFRKGGGAH